MATNVETSERNEALVSGTQGSLLDSKWQTCGKYQVRGEVAVPRPRAIIERQERIARIEQEMRRHYEVPAGWITISSVLVMKTRDQRVVKEAGELIVRVKWEGAEAEERINDSNRPFNEQVISDLGKNANDIRWLGHCVWEEIEDGMSQEAQIFDFPTPTTPPEHPIASGF
jgi:hypothetical protein